ncbi:21 kDa protein-like [Rhododendron vialii]|uniref:21 kDa protein-like n=1 Tax=Rhododendron vialii TaxID=182163 RepID=UPI00265FE469|nr:21 kDa protein-like [Rhododendron vialii]
MAGSCSNHFLIPLLILVTFTTYITSTSAARPVVARGTNNIEFIKTSCSSTTYPKLCYTTLATHASVIQTSPLLLTHTALSVTLNNTQSTYAMATKLLQSRNLSPGEVAAMHDCVEVLGDSVDQLRNSLGEMSRLQGSNFDLTMNDIQTWVSAAMTNEDTCTQGFSESKAIIKPVNCNYGSRINCGDVKNVLRGQVVNTAHLTSNALALVNNLASTRG